MSLCVFRFDFHLFVGVCFHKIAAGFRPVRNDPGRRAGLLTEFGIAVFPPFLEFFGGSISLLSLVIFFLYGDLYYVHYMVYGSTMCVHVLWVEGGKSF